MPNHIKNRLEISGSINEVLKVLDFIKVEKSKVGEYEYGIGTIDFEKITPMPLWVYGSSPYVSGISPEDESKYGKENTSLNWSRNNWGTKWNAYDQTCELLNLNEGIAIIYFSTAWNGVPKLIQKIAWIFPNVLIDYSYADENFGYNVGRYKFKDTITVQKYIPKDGSREAIELAFKVTNTTAEDHDLLLVNGEYVYKN